MSTCFGPIWRLIPRSPSRQWFTQTECNRGSIQPCRDFSWRIDPAPLAGYYNGHSSMSSYSSYDATMYDLTRLLLTVSVELRGIFPPPAPQQLNNHPKNAQIFYFYYGELIAGLFTEVQIILECWAGSWMCEIESSIQPEDNSDHGISSRLQI